MQRVLSALLSIFLFGYQLYDVIAKEIVSRDFPPGLSIPSDIILWGEYGYMGCFTDSAAVRSLTALHTVSSSMTIEQCLSYCNEIEGYYNLAYVGVEYGEECYCDWVLQDTAVQVDDSECNVPCAGNASEPCGAGNRLTIVSLGSSPTSAPATISTGGSNWSYQGCYQDSQTARILPNLKVVSYPQFFTLEECAFTCGLNGHTYAGIEHRNECWCGSSLPSDAALSPDADCGMACIYDYFERCGGSDRISVYMIET